MPNGMREPSALFTASSIFLSCWKEHLGGWFQLGRKGMEIEAILLSPRRLCLRLIMHGSADHGTATIMHGSADHGFGCGFGAVD